MSNLCPPTLGPFVCFNFGALLQMTMITIALSPCAFTMGKSPRRVATIGASKIALKLYCTTYKPIVKT